MAVPTEKDAEQKCPPTPYRPAPRAMPEDPILVADNEDEQSPVCSRIPSYLSPILNETLF